MPKAASIKPTKRDRVYLALHQARLAKEQGRPILETLNADSNLGEVIQTNLTRSHKQRYNLFLTQLHYAGSCIEYYKGEGMKPEEIRNHCKLTRERYFLSDSIYRVIKDPEVIPFLEDLSPKTLRRMSRAELEYVRNGVWPDVVDQAAVAQKELDQEKAMRDLIADLFRD